ncbi:MAG: hypothetical protein ABSC92_15350 [Rhizomicrobium sp.]
MANSWIVRVALGFSIAASVAVTLAQDGLAQSASPQIQSSVLPRLSFQTSKYFQSHPAAWAKFLAGLPHGASSPTQPAASVNSGFTGGSWQAVTAAPVVGLCNPLLLTDGTVIVASCGTPRWYKLTPDINGNYATGTWSKIAKLPVIGDTQYAPQYHASGILPDGRVIIMGGEYNGGQAVWTNLGAIYSPLTNQWAPVTAPAGAAWSQIGDAQSVVLANGRFMLASCCAYPAADALLDPLALTWTNTAAPSAGDDYQDEQGYNLMPDGSVMTIDVWTNFPNGGATNAEEYPAQKQTAATRTWINAGTMPVSLIDPAQCGNWEIGPAVVRGDDTLVAFGGNTGCVAPTADPTAIYTPAAGLWTNGPYVPRACGRHGKADCDLADAPAALLPNGDILFAASAGYGSRPTHFFEFTTGNFIKQVPDTLYFADRSGAYYYNFLVLPNGQILETDFSNTPEVYTASGSPVASLGPNITSAPSAVAACQTYQLAGLQLSGRSQGASYGDDVQAATNYPIVKIVNSGTGHVFYARTHGFSQMSIARFAKATTEFDVPGTVETGPSSLYAIANGVASSPVSVTVSNPGGC